MRYLFFTILLYCLIPTFNCLKAQNIDESWVWCEPCDSLTYFLDPSAQNWKDETKKGAEAWNKSTPWGIKSAKKQNEARITVKAKPINKMMQILANQNHHLADFAITEWGYIEIFGLRKPCVLKAEITYYNDPTNPPLNKLNTAMHEFGHALRLEHTDSRKDIMHPTEQNVTKLSSNDISSATESSKASNLNQLHIPLTPMQYDSVLTYGGVDVLIPGGAIEQPYTFGIRPLSYLSLLITSVPAERILAAAQIGPEWRVNEEDAYDTYLQKQIPHNKPVNIIFRLKKDQNLGIIASDGFKVINDNKPAINLSTIILAQVNNEGVATPIESNIKEVDGYLEVSTNIEKFGNYAVIANEVTLTKRIPQKTIILLAGIIILIFYLLLRKKRKSD